MQPTSTPIAKPTMSLYLRRLHGSQTGFWCSLATVTSVSIAWSITPVLGGAVAVALSAIGLLWHRRIGLFASAGQVHIGNPLRSYRIGATNVLRVDLQPVRYFGRHWRRCGTNYRLVLVVRTAGGKLVARPVFASERRTEAAVLALRCALIDAMAQTASPIAPGSPIAA